MTSVASEVIKAPKQSRSRSKLWCFRLLAIALVIGVLEFASFIGWMLLPPVDRMSVEYTQTAVALLGTERSNEFEVLHPYLGWVFNPDAVQKTTRPQDLVPVNALGFSDTGPSLRKRSPDRFIIGICGGSVAQQMSTIGEQAFRERLVSNPALQGRTIEVVRLAMSGFKQPQQLMALNYVLTLGGEFDVIVNIDGFNETGLVVGENNNMNVFAAYPRNWQARLQDVVDPRTSAMSYRLLKIRATRQSWAQWIVKSPLRRTWTASLIWAARDSILRQQQTNLALELREISQKQGRGFARQGPAQLYSNKTEMFDHAAEIWGNSSHQMYHVCTGNQIQYVHVLQPNQYHEGSKPLSAFELERCYAPEQDYAQAVKNCYPRLIAIGERLNKQGVQFCDLTSLFASETGTIYSDYFCHYNKRGTDMLAVAVADRIIEAVPK